MVDARALALVLALESSSVGALRSVRFGRRKTAYVATLVVKPEEYELVGFLDTDSGVDLLWRHTGQTVVRRLC